MTKEEFCEWCEGYCCNIYEHYITGNDDKIKLTHTSFFKRKDRFGVEPLKRVGNKCEYLGENGCIIKRENRPSQCIKYECTDMKKYFESDDA